jgi:hypothetical protein
MAGRMGWALEPKSGEPVGGLEAKDFEVPDKGRPEAIKDFPGIRWGKEPVEVILLVDGVNAGFQEVSQERGEFDAYLRGNGGVLVTCEGGGGRRDF